MFTESYKLSYIQRQKKQKRRTLACITFVCVLVLLQILFFFVIKPLRISSVSMMPEFENNSAVFVAPIFQSKTLFSQDETLVRGALVTIDNGTSRENSIFKKVVNFVFSAISFQKFRPYENNRWGDTEVYRIVGLPGDTLYIDNYLAYIRQGGSSHFLTEFELSDIEYDVISAGYPNNWNMDIGSKGKTEQISLQHNEYYLLCDNRIVSSDSRLFGTIRSEDINAKVIAQYFPFNVIRVIE